MRRNFLILEDNQAQLDMLSDIVAQVGSDINIYAVTMCEKAYKIAIENTIDCFLVDIILDTKNHGDTSGARFVSRIRNISRYYTTPVFFITSLEDPSNYAYRELHCLDYIEKPYDKIRIIENIKKVLQVPVMRENDKSLIFRKDGILYPILCDDIVYIECKNHKLIIHMQDGEIFDTQYKTCQDILEEADSDMLFQCSRSVIVNRRYIDSIDLVNRYIRLKQDKQIQLGIGTTYKKMIAGMFGKC